jgi:hypothetical protein
LNSYMRKQSWNALFVALVLSACHGERAQTPPPEPAEPELSKAEEGVRGVVLGEEFFADQILLEADEITFRQGKDFFADRAVNLSVFPDELAVPGTLTDAQVKLSHRPTGSGLPKDENAKAVRLRLAIAPAGILGAEVEIQLEADGPTPTRISGRGYATYKDLRVWNDAVDLKWDSFDTLRHVAQLHLQHAYEGARIEATNEFGMRIFDPGEDDSFKSAFIGYELTVDGSPKRLVKLQLLKNEEGWRVANELPADQIHEAHPLDAQSEEMSEPDVLAARALELELQKQGLMPRVRGTHIQCYSGRKEAHGSCHLVYELTSPSEPKPRCYGQNYRMERVAGEWTVSGEIGLKERVDYRTGNLVDHKPSTFGCRASDVTQST